MPLYHVVYSDGDEIRNYCLKPMPIAEAELQKRSFNNRYPNKPYPNGKGHYQFSEAWLEEVVN